MLQNLPRDLGGSEMQPGGGFDGERLLSLGLVLTPTTSKLKVFTAKLRAGGKTGHQTDGKDIV